MVITKYLGIDELEPNVKFLLIKFFCFLLINSFIMSLSWTFFSLYAIDKMGFTLTGIMLAVMLFTQFIFDYPSGSMGDYLGQRWVLTGAYLFFGIGFFFLAIAQDFTTFLIIAILNGFGSALFSGTLDSWLDTNYKKIDSVDTDRKIYGFARSRVNTANNVAFAASFMTGGFLSTIYSRQTVFALQFLLSLIMVIIVLTQIKEISIEADSEKIQTIPVKVERKKSQYFTYLEGGIRFMFSSKVVFFLLLGMAFITATWTIWAMIVLFPIYFGYTGDDLGANFLRTIIYLTGVPVGLYVAKLSKRLSTEHYPKFLLVFLVSFFPAFITLLIVIPAQNNFNLTGFVFTALIMIIIGFLYKTSEVLRMRLMVDLVPSENRNAVYSLLPTITSLLSMLLLPIVGQMIDIFGLVAGVVVVGSVFSAGFLFITIGTYLMKLGTKIISLDSKMMVEKPEQSESIN
ncbi:MAG: MFS transporter [Candidatus Heimdallarchaeota archaeon]|nr:MAG: MFS transporter [Candidatus Heimdallarchaeota archaeon]